MLARFLDRALQDFRSFREFASYIYVRRPRVECEAGNEDSFEQLMWVFVNDVAVFERSRLRFVGVADQVDGLFLIRLDETPLHAARKSGAAAAAQAGCFYFVQNVNPRHRHGLFKLLVTAVIDVGIDVDLPTGAANVFENQAMLERMGRLRIADCGLWI